jgi:DNA-damage-inducible protein D
MKSVEIKTLFVQFEQASGEYEGIECWSARELQKLLGYTQWRNFENIIEKARESCRNAGETVSYHFADVSKVIEAGKGAKHEIDDILLTRYACYLIAQNGDSKKEQIKPLFSQSPLSSTGISQYKTPLFPYYQFVAKKINYGNTIQ